MAWSRPQPFPVKLLSVGVAPIPCAVFGVGRKESGGEMIQGYDIICFSNDWDADPLSKKHIMQRLATHNRVLWVNSFGMRTPTASARDFKGNAKKLWGF